MSAEFERLVGHTVMNFDFCQGLLEDTEATLEKGGFVLSESERTQLLTAVNQMNNQAANQGTSRPGQVAGRFW
jgi:hypothetical protein